MNKILVISMLALLNHSIGFSQDIDFSQSKLDIQNLGLDQGGKIQFISDVIIPANIDEMTYELPGYKYCILRFKEKKPFLRVLKKGNVFNIAKVENVSIKNRVHIDFISRDQEKGITQIACGPWSYSAEIITEVFGGKIKILAPEPLDIQSAIIIPENQKASDAPKIAAAEVVQKLPQACVYIGLWKEKDQLPNLTQNAKNYLDTLIPILRGTFKSLNNIDCESISKEKLVEAAIKLSEDKNVNDNSRNTTKSKNGGTNNKAKTKSSKNM